MTETGTPAPGIGAIKTVGVPVSDQDRALAFYTETLDFELRIDMPIEQLGARWIAVAPEGTDVLVALVKTSGDSPVGVETGIRFNTADARATHEALSAHGVDVGELLTWPGVPPMFVAHDQDGNRFEIVQA